MPLHDWSAVHAGVFHDFRLSWCANLAKSLNTGILPAEYYVMQERHPYDYDTSVEMLDALIMRQATEREMYALLQNTLVIRRASGDRLVALIEIVSPGNKSTAGQVQSLLRKLSSALHRGYHLLIIDIFPPGLFDSHGIHGAFWDFGQSNTLELPADNRGTLASYEAGQKMRAYVEPVGLAQALPPMPLFLEPGWYVNVPLEPSYAEAYASVPERWRSVIEG